MRPLPANDPGVRILYVLTGGVIGGITSGLLGLLRHLPPRRWRAMVVTGTGSPALSSFRRQGVPCAALPPRHPQAFLQRLIEGERIQLIHSCDAATEGARVAYRMGLPHVWFIGGTLESTFAAPSSEALRAMRLLIERLASVVVIPSRSLARAAFPDLPARKLRVIPWGIDLPSPPSSYYYARGWLRRRLAIPPTAPLVAMVGNFYPAKRHLQFLRAAALIHRALPEARFLIAGRCVRGSPSAARLSRCYRARVTDAIRRQRLEPLVTVTEFSPEDRAAWYRDVTLVLCPSVEGCSQALLEAGACGVPVVAVKAGGTPEVFQHGRSGLLVPVGDANAMARAALRALRDPALAQRLGHAARRRILNRFHAGRQAARFQRLYAALLTTGSGSHTGGR